MGQIHQYIFEGAVRFILNVMPAFNVYILLGKLDPHCAKTYLNFGITTPKDLDYLGDSGAHNPK